MEYIANDFKVKQIGEQGDSLLYHGLRPLHHHFVYLITTDNQQSSQSFLISNGVRKQLAQSYVHRYELANLYLEGDSPQLLPLMNNDLLRFQFNKTNDIAYYRMLTEEVELPFYISGTKLNKEVAKDAKVLAAIRSKSNQNKEYGDMIITQYFERNKIGLNLIERVTAIDKEWLLFEIELNAGKKKQSNRVGLGEIYTWMLGDTNEPTQDMIWNFDSKFDWIIGQESCDCGSPGCFFDELKANQRYFFGNDAEALTRRGEELFKKLWTEITPRQRAALLYLDNCFGNTPMLNLSFLRPDFDLSRYQFLMTFPYQPDSEEERDLRLVTTNTEYFLRIGKEINGGLEEEITDE